MFDIPEHPVIENLMRTGYPDGREPEEKKCPICGEAPEQFFEDKDGTIVGCDYCIKTKYYYEYEAEEFHG